ncbi:BtrH N-terminal domain-containing protein [Nonomuraea sp. SYSU D8015]|uniref:BtrH N-terminal domain-containing protein n=1 Tax=Nonomuraea sp. SYSU D8015 TaxID=2593644 RepID=UPI001CB6F9E6|nr:BtrH N-terminal domain-containing protein [Nonomuraea sp. SYSU D8015]
MTSKKQLKARIRARMAKTGESYTTARNHVLGRSETHADAGWRFAGGRHPSSAAITAVLVNQGADVREPLVFLAGGGIGAGYILWEFKHDDSRHVTLGFRNQWQYHDRWMAKTLARLGVPYEEHRTAGARGASERLAAELDAGRPCVILPDRYHLGYWQLPAAFDGHGGGPVVAYRRDEGGVWLDDRGQAPIRVPRERLDAARARVPSYKNVMHVLGEAKLDEATLAGAAREGLRDCAAHLSATSDSFSLPAWRKWSRLMADTRNAKAWPKVFADGRGLADALLSVWEGAEPAGMDGGNLRELFADALDEAVPLLGEPELAGLAERFREIHALWHGLAEAALPAEVPEFARVRELTVAIKESVMGEGSAGADEAAENGRLLWQARAAANESLAATDTAALFADLGTRLGAIHAAETAAVARLSELVR